MRHRSRLMCAPEFCPVHNFRDVDWDELAAAVKRRPPVEIAT